MAHTPQTAASAEHVTLVGRISAWLEKAGVANSGMAVDFADIVAAAGRVAQLLEATLARDPTAPPEADQALTSVAEMHAWLFTEMKPHLEGLEQAWPALEDRLEQLSPEE